MKSGEMLQSLLCSERVRLTAVTSDDMTVIARWYQNPDFLRLFDARTAMPLTESAIKGYIEEQQKSKEGLVFAIRLWQDGQMGPLIGLAELDDILWNHQVAWLSIGLGEPQHWGQGYGTEVMRLLLDFAFGELNLRRVQLTVFEYNPRAIALYEKMGFQREGVFREFLHRDGKKYDMYLYGILSHEWKGGAAC